MEEFLTDLRGVENFTFEDPSGDGIVKVVCGEYEVVPLSFGRYRLRAVFEEVYV
jgi:phage-related protein